jgi:hypothetical protein
MAVVLCASFPQLYCPGATRPRQACSRLTSSFRVASYCRRVGLVRVYALSYACTTVNAHHVSLACMQSPCVHHAPHCTAQALRAEAAAYATLARSSSKVFKSRPRAKRGRGIYTLRSHDFQRASRKLSVPAATLSSPCVHHSPSNTAQAAAYATFARLSTCITETDRSKRKPWQNFWRSHNRLEL